MNEIEIVARNANIQHILIDRKQTTMADMKNQITNPGDSLFLRSQFQNTSADLLYVSPQLATKDIDLYKQTGVQQKKWDYLGTFSRDDSPDKFSCLLDSNVANHIPVRYMVSSNIDSEYPSLKTDYIRSNWDTWSIQDIVYDTQNQVYKTTGNIYLFKSNLDSGEINANSNTIKYDSLGRYGRVYKGDMKYESSQISCLFGDFKVCQDINRTSKLIVQEVTDDEGVKKAIMYSQDFNNIQEGFPLYSPYPIFKVEIQDNPTWNPPKFDPYKYNGYYLYVYGINNFKYEKYYKSNGIYWEEVSSQYLYLEDRDKLEAWLDFVYNNNLKLLKDCQGNKWIVSITDSISRSIDNNSAQYPTRISFTWQEVMDAKTTPIINIWPLSSEE